MARVRLSAGDGQVQINDRTANEYIPVSQLRDPAFSPLGVGENAKKFDVAISVAGGGPTGQVGAIAHGIPRALLQVDKENTKALRHAGLLTRDPRAKERKKPGLKRARKAPQFTKR